MKIEQLTTFVVPPRWLFLKIETDARSKRMKALPAGASLSSRAGQSCFAHDLKVLSRRQDCPELGAHERVVVDQQHLELVRPASLLATGDLTQPNSTGHRTRGDS
jgi:hypothetical protein